MTTTIVRMRRDWGVTYRRGKRGESPVIEPRSSAQIEAAAKRDKDNLPLTKSSRARLRRVPRVKTLRRALGLTQREFAARYHIPVGTLRDWEQGAKQPDHAAQAYLRAIAGDPVGVQRALHAALGHAADK